MKKKLSNRSRIALGVALGLLLGKPIGAGGAGDDLAGDRPDEFCLETAFYGKNIQSTLKLGHVRGVALLCAEQYGLPIAEYSPREIKRSVTGNGAAAKQQVSYMVRTLLGIREEFRHLDEADSLALAICHAMHATSSKKPFASWKEFIAAHPERERR